MSYGLALPRNAKGGVHALSFALALTALTSCAAMALRCWRSRALPSISGCAAWLLPCKPLLEVANQFNALHRFE